MQKQLTFCMQHNGSPKSCKCLGAETDLVAQLSNECEKPGGVTCGFVSYVKMLFCFISLFPKMMLFCVLGCPLNSAGNFEEGLAVPARTMESPLKTSK